MEYKVVTENSIHELWASGFYGEQGKRKAQRLIDEGYFHKHMYEKDRHKNLIVVEVSNLKEA